MDKQKQMTDLIVKFTKECNKLGIKVLKRYTDKSIILEFIKE